MKRDFIDHDVYDEIMGGVNLVSGDEFRTIMCTISQLSADIVKKTLGPYGSTTIIDEGGGYVRPTKDGWSALSKIRFRDTIYNTAFNILKEISFNAVSSVGDGTTTAMVVANAFIQKALREGSILEPGFNQALYRKAAEELANDIIEELENSYARKIDIRTEAGVAAIWTIAYIATNGNEEVASMIANIYQETQNTNIHVQVAQKDKIEYEIQAGYKIYARPISFNAYVNADDNTIIKKDTNVIVFDHNVTYIDHGEMIMAISAYASKNDTEIIVMAPYFDDTIATRVGNQVVRLQKNGNVSNIMLVQVPATTELQRKAIRDIALLTNATVMDMTRVRIFKMLAAMNRAITDGKEYNADTQLLELSKDLGYETTENVLEGCVGSIKFIELHETEAYLRDFESMIDHKLYEQVLKEAKEEYEAAKLKVDKTMNASLDKDLMTAHMRYVRLLGKTGVINVGGASDYQKSCDKDAIDDAVKVCASAAEDGYVRGMNLDVAFALLTVYNDMQMDGPYDPHTYRAYRFEIAGILFDAFKTAALEVLRNSVADDSYRWDIDAWMVGNDILPLEQLESEKKIHPDYKGMSSLNVCNAELIETLTTHREIIYDLRHNTMGSAPIDGSVIPAVITSVANDAQILRAVVSVLSVIITSNQFMSTTQIYDRKKTKAQGYAELTKTEMMKGGAFMKGALMEIEKKSDMLRDIFSSPMVSGYMEVASDEQSSVDQDLGTITTYHYRGVDVQDDKYSESDKDYVYDDDLPFDPPDTDVGDIEDF